MSIERYSTALLLSMMEEAEAPSMFWTNAFFGNEIQFEEQMVEFDIVRRGRRMAPFVAPTVRGQVMARDGHVTKFMKPAYIKQTSTVGLHKPLSRMPGEAWGGSLSPTERLNRLMSEDLNQHSLQLENRLEWMATQTIFNGGYTVSGPNYPAQQVDFGMDANLNVALAGAATWDQATSSPLQDIEDMAREVRLRSYGVICNDVIMDRLAWSLFRDHADIKELLNLDVKRADQAGTNFDLGIRNNMFGNGEGVEQVGTVAGRFRIWVYEGYYEDNNGVTQQFMPDYTVVVCNPPAVEGQQLYGRILDMDANYAAQKFFIKSRSQWDPSGEEVLSQTAPLIAPKRVDSWGILTVA